MKEIKRVFTFDRSAVHRDDALKEVQRASAMAHQIADEAEGILAGLTAPEAASAPFGLRLALEEVCTNIVWHDMLGLTGDEREHYFHCGKISETEEAFVNQQIESARGLCAELMIAIGEDGVTLAIILARPFPDFERLWQRAQVEPDEEEIERCNGRGIRMMAILFTEAAYVASEQKIVFTARWPDAQ